MNRPEDPSESAPKQPMKILVADDSRTERLILSAQLRKWGYDFVLASSGEEALKHMLMPGHPRLAILDWVMPGLTGPEVVKFIRKKMKNDYVYCILVTSLGSKEDIVEGLQSGADDYITKPVHGGELRVRLRAAERLLKAWEAIARSEAQTRAILDSAGDAVLVVDRTGGIGYANPRSSLLLGKPEQELIGASLYDFLPTNEEKTSVTNMLRNLEAQPGPIARSQRIQLNIKRAMRETATVSLAANFRHSQPDAISIFMTDVSEQKRLEIELQHARKLEAVGQLAAGIAHEINTPVQFVGDSITYLEQSFQDFNNLLGTYDSIVGSLPAGTLSEEQEDDLEDAKEDADLEYQQEQMPKAFSRTQEGLARVARIVRAMKEFSRKDATLGVEPADLNRALESTLVVAQNEYRYVADVERQFNELPQVQCNLGDLNQVFLNLLVNASHAITDANEGTGKRGIIRITTHKLGEDWVRIDIADSGTGIPEEVRDRIFEPFYTTKEVGKGTGQGLAIAHSIVVDKHQGKLDFKTQTGVGTTFSVHLPVRGPAEH
ncbi:MAG: response regulator [Deltaproteobacteria bacterium]|jgi:two-component system, NtrC family, sensor kinase|nr:response regulator [Deltaproteobacteria bacterium]MBT6490487.1 response regulator [Deltaproteobacteria bacterium]